MKKWRVHTKTRYIVYLTLIHVAMAVLTFVLLIDQLYFFLPLELLLLFSYYQGIRFYGIFLAPVRLVESGESAMRDRDFTSKFLPVGSPEVDKLVSLYNTMIDNLRAERTGQREQHFFLHKLMSTAELGIIVLDYDGRVERINDWAALRLGLSPEHKLPFTLGSVDHPMARALDQLPPEQPEVITPGDNRRYRAERGRFVDQGFERFFILIQDITSDLLAAEKEAYGKVIRMMAHEVNNSTGATNSLLRSLVESAEEDDPGTFHELAEEYLPVVIARGKSMNTFMRKFADVIRMPPAERVPTDLGALAERVATLCRPQCREYEISLTVKRPPSSFYLSLDAAQIEQLLINAVTNARESIGRGGQIELLISQRPAGIVVVDNGPGIPPEAGDRLFSPFFSTKVTGQGVGLTLSRDILEQHGARYRLYTDERDGLTRFEMWF